MVEDKINAFLEYLEKQGEEISGETAFICNDGAVLVIPNANNAVDIMLVRNPVKVDYTLGITAEDVDLWNSTAELMSILGGSENGGD